MTVIAQTYRKENGAAHDTLGSALFQIVGSSLLIALCSQIKFVLPFTPVPLTLQTLAVLLVGASLGSRKGPAPCFATSPRSWPACPFYPEGLQILSFLSVPKEAMSSASVCKPISWDGLLKRPLSRKRLQFLSGGCLHAQPN